MACHTSWNNETRAKPSGLELQKDGWGQITLTETHIIDKFCLGKSINSFYIAFAVQTRCHLHRARFFRADAALCGCENGRLPAPKNFTPPHHDLFALFVSPLRLPVMLHMCVELSAVPAVNASMFCPVKSIVTHWSKSWILNMISLLASACDKPQRAQFAIFFTHFKCAACAILWRA